MSRRGKVDQTNEDGVQDSFLDIVANMVGILILLVIVVGVRAATQPRATTADDSSSEIPLLTQAVLSQKAETVLAAKKRLVDSERTAIDMGAEAEIREQERLDLATYVTAVEQGLEQEKQKLSQADQERLAIRSQLAEADYTWHHLMQEKVGLASAPSESGKIVHTPTPIVRDSSDQTLHLRLEKGRVAIVPFEPLLKLINSRDFDAHKRDLDRQGGIGRLGPIQGFELHYALISRTAQSGANGQRGVSTFVAGEIHPSRENLGDPVSAALQQGSTLTRVLASTSPRETIVMVWAYPDSTTEFRELQTGIRELGYSVDLRLLPAGAHIAFSPEGRKAAAQ